MAIEGDVRFLSHRDFARLIERAACRAGLPLEYSRGFNPHPRIALAWPRPVGVASRDELAIIRLEGPAEPRELPGRLNRQVPPGVTFREAFAMSAKQSPRPVRIRHAWPIPPGRAEFVARGVRRFLESPQWLVRRRKPPRRSGRPAAERIVDLKHLVEDLAIQPPLLCWTLVPDGQLWARCCELLEAIGLDGRADLADVVRTEIEYAF
ncbi:MAG: DUF2344 domain-containing protein [Planctomycetes bacterium]|nr:DUF2344 domain-containing protein [Planctomycetota bacterium]